MRQCVLCVTAMLVLPCLALAAGRQTEEGVCPARGDGWIKYDQEWVGYWTGGSAWCWYTGAGGSPWYAANIFYPLDPNWYPFQIIGASWAMYYVDGNTTATGTVGPLRIFTPGGNVVGGGGPWGGVAPLSWTTQSLTDIPTVTGGYVFGGVWNDAMGNGGITTGDGVFVAEVDPTLWPPPHYGGEAEPNRFMYHTANTPYATTGWSAYEYTDGRTKCVALWVLMAGENVPIELYELAGEARASYVVLRWTTASEQDNYGFNVHRSTSEDGAYAKVNDELIRGHGTTAEPHSYVFADYDVEKATTYYYKVEDVAIDGSTTQHGPVAVPMGDEVASSWGTLKAAFK